MNFQTTQLLLEDLKTYCDLEDIRISTDNTDWSGCPYQSDFVTLIECQDVGFEVFANEIIVFYFTDHVHFEDYSGDLEEGDSDYIQRAREFLKQLFTLPLRKYEIYKGKKLRGDKYYFLLPNGEEERIGGTWYGLLGLLNPFAKKRTTAETWQYDAEQKRFTSVSPWVYDPAAVNTIAIGSQWHIEIYENNGVYTYQIFHLEFDDYGSRYFWLPHNEGCGSFFDTEERAAADAERQVRDLMAQEPPPRS